MGLSFPAFSKMSAVTNAGTCLPSHRSLTLTESGYFPPGLQRQSLLIAFFSIFLLSQAESFLGWQLATLKGRSFFSFLLILFVLHPFGFPSQGHSQPPAWGCARSLDDCRGAACGNLLFICKYLQIDPWDPLPTPSSSHRLPLHDEMTFRFSNAQD